VHRPTLGLAEIALFDEEAKLSEGLFSFTNNDPSTYCMYGTRANWMNHPIYWNGVIFFCGRILSIQTSNNGREVFASNQRLDFFLIKILLTKVKKSIHQSMSGCWVYLGWLLKQL